MMPAAKHFDPIMGIDIHIIQPPGPVPPVPVPHPFVGFVIDPMDYAPVIGATVLINGIPRAIAGTAGKGVPPHIPIGGVFVKPPTNEAEIFMGSMTVEVDGDAMSHLLHPALSCHDVGMIPPPRKKPSKVKSMVLPTSMVMVIPGPPVLIGGPPTISLMAIGMRIGMNALGKALKKLKKTKAFKRLSKKAKKLKGKAKKLKGKAKKLKDKIKKKLKKRKPSHNKGCGKPGEPVYVVTGANVDDFIDFELPGPHGFQWKRYYDSTWNDIDGPMGRSFRHEFQRELERTPEGYEYTDPEGDTVVFPDIPPEDKEVSADGMRLRRVGHDVFQIAETGQPTMEFRLNTAEGPAPLRALRRDTDRLEFEYDRRGTLTTIQNTGHWRLRLDYDDYGHINALRLREREPKERLIARYQHDNHGNLLVWQDALGNRAVNQYDTAHRMIKKTDRNGYSYHYEYDDEGRCIHTYGEDGLYDIRFEYVPEAGYTVATYADGSTWQYLYNEDEVITEIIDPYGA
ncbi:MAG: hypothetical protein GF341_03160, partial [candidate division Zixibacteria bacterium]|nr:hypothetical protein [candidate division Zixibacteria bacterium]